MQDYILNYKSEKENNIDNVANFFKELLIDALLDLFLDINITNKLFLTQFGPLENIKSANTVNNVADNAFKYQITFTNTIVLFVNLMPYSFIILTNMRYKNQSLKDCKLTQVPLLNLQVVLVN